MFNKIVRLVAATLFVSGIANGYSGTGSNGTCFSYSCKIVLPEPIKQEALSVLSGEKTISENLRLAIENQRNLEAVHIGAEKAQQLEDNELLAIIVSK